MRQAIYLNLAVTGLRRSKTFFEQTGFTFNNLFSDETAISIEISENISVMLLTHEKFSEFTPRPISDAKQVTEVLVALQVESREGVDQVANAAFSAGADTVRDSQKNSFMYGRSFSDLDGHICEVFWMDSSTIPVDGELS